MLNLMVNGAKVSQSVNVVISNTNTFGPKEAIAAVHIAGCGTPATVIGHGRGYIVTGKTVLRAQRLSAEEEYDAGMCCDSFMS